MDHELGGHFEEAQGCVSDKRDPLLQTDKKKRRKAIDIIDANGTYRIMI